MTLRLAAPVDDLAWTRIPVGDAIVLAEKSVVGAMLAYGPGSFAPVVPPEPNEMRVPEHRVLLELSADVPPGDCTALAIRVAGLPDVGAAGGMALAYALHDGAPPESAVPWYGREWRKLLVRDQMLRTMAALAEALHLPGVPLSFQDPGPEMRDALSGIVDARRVLQIEAGPEEVLIEAARELGAAKALALILDELGNPGPAAVAAERRRG